MSDLPSGWRRVRLGDVAETALGKMLDRGKTRGGKQVPYLRNLNVQWGRFDLSNVAELELMDDELDRFEVRAGDLLACEGGEIGRCAIWPGSDGYIAYQKALHRIRPSEELDSRLLRYALEDMSHRGVLAAVATGSTIKHLPQVALRSLPMLLPPLDEQHRIVALLEDHLSRLDAGADYLTAATHRGARMATAQIAASLLSGAVDPDAARHAAVTDAGDLPALRNGWRWSRIGELCDVVGGVTKNSGKQHAADFVEVPYLRVANVQRGRLDLSLVKTIRVPVAQAAALRLATGDVLMNEGGDRDKLGRGWIWSGQLEQCIHQNHVFRARIRDDAMRPKLLSWWTNTIGGEWCERHGRQSVNLASISLTRIRQMPLPVPPVCEQEALEAAIDDIQAAVERLESARTRLTARARALRNGLLAAAFSGRL